MVEGCALSKNLLKLFWLKELLSSLFPGLSLDHFLNVNGVFSPLTIHTMMENREKRRKNEVSYFDVVSGVDKKKPDTQQEQVGIYVV